MRWLVPRSPRNLVYTHGVVIVDPGFIQSPSYDLPTLMSKFMALGVGRDMVIEMVTAWPAQVFGYGVALGALKPGTDADIGIFEAREEASNLQGVVKRNARGTKW